MNHTQAINALAQAILLDEAVFAASPITVVSIRVGELVLEGFQIINNAPDREAPWTLTVAFNNNKITLTFATHQGVLRVARVYGLEGLKRRLNHWARQNMFANSTLSCNVRLHNLGAAIRPTFANMAKAL